MGIGRSFMRGRIFFSVALLHFFCMPSQADPSEVLNGEAGPAAVTCEIVP